MNDIPEVHMLFVEDSEDDVALALRELTRDGLTVSPRRVETEEALRHALGERKPTIIVSDFAMPRFDGLQSLRICRELVPDVPFIFVSGTIGEERAIEAIRLGATDYVLKGNLRRLATSVKRALKDAVERERVRAAEEEKLRLVEILEATSDYVGIADLNGRLLYINRAGRKMVGISSVASFGGRGIQDAYAPWARELIEREGRVIASREGVWKSETSLIGADGTEIPVSQVVIAHRAEDGSVRYLSTIARDISDRKAYEARLEYLANYDALSTLPNRNLLSDRVAQAIKHAKRTDRTCGVIVLDIDQFKLLNDSYGHLEGDALLRSLAQRLSAAIRDGDTVARIGADGFAVLAANLMRPEDLLTVARKFTHCVRDPFTVGGHEAHITLSIGASSYPRDGETFEILLRNAHAAMHRVKNEGGNAIQFYDASMTHEATERVEIENALRGAISKEQLEMRYQPQVEARSGQVVGVEALIRWRHPGRGYISPAAFIPIAEDSDLIHELGGWTLRKACELSARWRGAGYPVRMAVNVSARQFRSEGFPDVVANALRTYDMDAGHLELELTEGVLIEDRSRAIAILERLKEIGVQIAIDDFGVGYSSLSYLSGLPVDCLKIDRSFVVQAQHGGRDMSIVQAIISLGHTLGMRVLAEGVETPAQLQMLRDNGCDECQGYLFAHPLPADSLEQWIAQGLIGNGG